MLTRFASIRLEAPVPAIAATGGVRRTITPGAGKALEILAHALEYLSDECAVSDEPEPWLGARMDAIKLLKTLNRGIYLACPEAPAAGSRCRAFFRRCFS